VTEDRQLSGHFTLYGLTVTGHTDLRAENRDVSDEELLKLAALAAKLEECWALIGPLDVHSGRRFSKLNRRVGGSSKSQHMLCEAADISPAGPDTEGTIEAAFAKLARAVRDGLLAVGQLIIESAAGDREGRKYWIHVSLGAPYRDPAKCSQIFKMRDGKVVPYIIPTKEAA